MKSFEAKRNEASPPMEGQSFLGRFGFVLASFIPALGRARYSEARNKKVWFNNRRSPMLRPKCLNQI